MTDAVINARARESEKFLIISKSCETRGTPLVENSRKILYIPVCGATNAHSAVCQKRKCGLTNDSVDRRCERHMKLMHLHKPQIPWPSVYVWQHIGAHIRAERPRDIFTNCQSSIAARQIASNEANARADLSPACPICTPNGNRCGRRCSGEKAERTKRSFVCAHSSRTYRAHVIVRYTRAYTAHVLEIKHFLSIAIFPSFFPLSNVK